MSTFRKVLVAVTAVVLVVGLALGVVAPTIAAGGGVVESTEFVQDGGSYRLLARPSGSGTSGS